LCHMVTRLNSNCNIMILSDILGMRLLRLSTGSGNLPLLVSQAAALKSVPYPYCIHLLFLPPEFQTICCTDTSCFSLYFQNFTFSNMLLHFCVTPSSECTTCVRCLLFLTGDHIMFSEILVY
jgi:hypothetical protein